MPHSSPGFTPINHCDKPSASELAAATQPSQPNRETRRRRKNPLIQKYLSSGKSAGPSMFERAAISHGEDFQLKKRKTIKDLEGDKKQYGAPEKKARSMPNCGGRRVVSEGMRTSKPFAFAPGKLHHPAFNPRSAEDKLVTSSGISDQRHKFISEEPPSTSNALLSKVDRPSVMDDNIPVVASLTSMDIISARSTSSSTPEKLSALKQTSCDKLPLYRTADEHGSSQTNRVDDTGDSEAKYIDDAPSHISHSPIQSQRTPNYQRVHTLSRNPRLDTIVEEVEADEAAVTSDNDGKWSTFPSANHLETREHTYDDYDIFDDGLSDIELLRNVDENEVQLPQEDTNDLSTSKLAPREEDEQGCSQAVDRMDMEQFFAEDWELSEDEAADASIDPATILNQVSSNVQKVQATPTALSSSCAETQNVQSPDLTPILRPPFPDRVQERSPVLGLSGATSLRVCFRIGEALNVGIQAVRERQSVVIELYARVRWSFREPRSIKQHFIFMDLFHDRPPYIDGTYDGWKGVELYENDSVRFLERSDRPLICRCIGRLKRDGTSWRLMIANIWEASIDDVEHVLRVIQS